MSPGTKLAIGIGAAAVALVGVGVLEHRASAAAAKASSGKATQEGSAGRQSGGLGNTGFAPTSVDVTLTGQESAIHGVGGAGSRITLHIPDKAQFQTVTVDGAPFDFQPGGQQLTITTTQNTGVIDVQWIDASAGAFPWAQELTYGP